MQVYSPYHEVIHSMSPSIPQAISNYLLESTLFQHLIPQLVSSTFLFPIKHHPISSPNLK